ncbi:MAG TPA: hypothetical protein VHJ82_08525, partial [Actinomycetota bacterium]|nr:hypothetical protein [Actinomycetota bacterium]
MATLRLRAHAKVNLVLRVVGRRDDGYHDVETVLHSIDFADYIELSGRAEGFEFSVQQLGPLGDARIEPLGNDDASRMSVDAEGLSAIPVDQNIVLRAAQALEHAVDKKLPTEIRLGKRIPVGGGMGGGSADAVATLLGLRKLHDIEVSDAAVMEIAARLGADVPFFLHGGTVLATGIGEKLERLTDPPRLWFVLGISKRPLWTKDVYAAWDEIAQGDSPSVKTMIDALASGEVSEIG